MNTTLSPSPSLIARHSPVTEAGTAFDGFQASHAKPPSNFFQNSATFRHPLSPFLPFAAIFRHSRAPSDFRVLLCARDIFMRCLLTALRSGCHPGLHICLSLWTCAIARVFAPARLIRRFPNLLLLRSCLWQSMTCIAPDAAPCGLTFG